MTIVVLTAASVSRGVGVVVQAIVNVKKEGREELKVKGLTKEGVEEPVTVADTNSNNVGVRALLPSGYFVSRVRGSSSNPNSNSNSRRSSDDIVFV